jgi:Outer membrane receptor proteins, mostly Fe transport
MSGTRLIIAAAALGVSASVGTLSAQTQAPSPAAPPTFTSSVTETVDVAVHAVTTEHVGRPEIDARHARTLDEALDFTPGIRVRSGGDGRPVIDVRGLRPRHVLLLLDGVPLNATNDGQFDASLIPTDFLQDITVTFGAASVLYGDGGMGGVIELTPPAPQKRLEANADVDWRGGDRRSVAGHLMKATDRVSALVAARSFTSNGFRLPRNTPRTSIEDGGTRNNSDIGENTVFGKLSVALTNRWRIATSVTTSGGDYGVPPSIVDDSADRFAQRPRYERVERYRTRASQFSWDYRGERPLSLRGWAFVNDEHQRRVRYDGPSYDSISNETVPGTFQTDDVSTVSGGSIHARYNFGRIGELKTAFNGRHEQFASDGVIRDVDLASGSPTAGGGGRGGTGQGAGAGARRFGLRALNSDHAVNVLSGGVEWEARPTQGTGIVAGYALNMQDGSETERRTSPTLLAAFFKQWPAGMTVHAAAFRRMRFPSIGDLYETGSGNPDLKPERSRGVEAGVDRRIRRATASVNAFVMNTRDFIERTDDASRYISRDRYRLAGMNTSVRSPVTSRIAMRGTYSYLYAVDRSPGSQRSQLQYQPRHRASIESRWKVTRSLDAQLAVAWTGAERYSSRMAPVTTATTKPYTFSDIAITQQLIGSAFSVRVGVNNAFDRYHESPYGMPGPGRTLYISLRAQGIR